MRYSFASFITFASMVNAIPAPQRGNWGHGRSSAAAPAASSEVAPPPASNEVVIPAASTGGVLSTGTTGTGTSSGSDDGAGTTNSSNGNTNSGAGSGSSGGGTGTGGDSHTITAVNNCGSGFIEYKFGSGEVKKLSGSVTLDGPLPSGNMWLQDYDGNQCGPDGTDCGMVEFTLGDNGHNAINYSVLMGINGNHVLRAPMFIELVGGTCSAKASGPCTGMSVAECPNGYTGLDTNTGPPVDCKGTGVGAKITFCP